MLCAELFAEGRAEPARVRTQLVVGRATSDVGCERALWTPLEPIAVVGVSVETKICVAAERLLILQFDDFLIVRCMIANVVWYGAIERVLWRRGIKVLRNARAI